MKLDENFFFSQHALNMFKMCPVRFQKRYIDGLYWNSNRMETRGVERGRDFHILADRYFSKVPLKMKYFEEYGELNDWMDALENHVPMTSKGTYYPEYQIKVYHRGMKLQAKYDLLYIDGDGKITIYDWKTQGRPIEHGNVASSIQTRVYRYVMALGGHRLVGEEILPEDITMRYWQPKFPSRTIELAYSQEEFLRDERFLEDLIMTIENYDYDGYDKTLSAQICHRCEFNYFCNTDKVEYSLIFLEEDIELDSWDDLDDIHF